MKYHSILECGDTESGVSQTVGPWDEERSLGMESVVPVGRGSESMVEIPGELIDIEWLCS